MSFILDALRKSESERQREAPPSPTRIPLAVARAGLPAWVWLVIGALSVTVLAIGAAWWRSAAPGPAASSVATASDPGEIPLERGLAPASPDDADPNARLDGEAAPAGRRNELDIGPTPLGQGARPVRYANASALPSVAEILAEGIALPPLDLQLISYSENVADRFVFINGTQYREGQRVRNGPQIVSILPQGAVLTQQGRDFLLAPN